MSSTEQPGAEPDAALVERVAQVMRAANPNYYEVIEEVRAVAAVVQMELAAAREAGRREAAKEWREIAEWATDLFEMNTAHAAADSDVKKLRASIRALAQPATPEGA